MRMMDNTKCLMVSLILLLSTIGVVSAQDRMNEFVVEVDEAHNPMSIYANYGATPNDGVVIINSTIPDLEFGIMSVAKERLKVVPDKGKNRYLLIIQPNDSNYKQYTITINAKGFKQGKIDSVVVKAGLSTGYVVNPKKSSALEKLARITVYDKDNKLLVGAEVKNKSTGWVYGSTRTDGTIEINFDRKGQTANVIVSHPSYSDTKEIAVQAGVHDYKVYLRNYRPPKNPPKPAYVPKCQPEKFTLELSAIGGSNLGVALDMTASYFLIGLGVDWMILAPEQTNTTSLVNSGYTGTFTKTTTMTLSGSRTNVFLDLGAYFKYFSLSCQVGLLCGTTINRASQYDGWGYGLVDGDLDEYWGSYEHRSFTNTTSDKELHLTLTPQVKGYIPVGKNKTSSLSIGLGYTFIPTLNYYQGLSGSIGMHFRFKK